MRATIRTKRGPDGTTPLHWAAHVGDVAEVERLLRAGAQPNVANDYGATPMSEAAAIGDAAVLALLLKAGADVESANAEGQTALMAVARTGNVEAARLLLRHGAKVDAVERWGGQTALTWAAAQRQPEMVKLLIQRGANVNARSVVRDWQRRVTAEGRPKDMNRGGLTPLLYATREGCLECVKHLVARRRRHQSHGPGPHDTPAARSAQSALRYCCMDGRARGRREQMGSLRPDAFIRRRRHEHAAEQRTRRSAVARFGHRSATDHSVARGRCESERTAQDPAALPPGRRRSTGRSHPRNRRDATAARRQGRGPGRHQATARRRCACRSTECARRHAAPRGSRQRPQDHGDTRSLAHAERCNRRPCACCARPAPMCARRQLPARRPCTAPRNSAGTTW